ncbi:MAG: peptide chain release factor N(5)-glutamine methyltransferase [Desulfobacterales bacterium]|jgi:release factor glutamine methyltransferase
MPENKFTDSGNTQWTIIKLIHWANSYLKGHDIDSPRATGEILLAHALDVKRIDLYLNYDQPLVADELKTFKMLIKRRIRREPVAYILGTKEFWSMDLMITPDVLIPRPETECLVEVALKYLSQIPSVQTQRILELGTGSGAIILALISQEPRHLYFASDYFKKAAALANRNAVQNDFAGRIHFFVGDWLDPLNSKKSSFDMIVSNPPYIPSRVIDSLQPEIRCFEPHAALNGDYDGLSCYRNIIGNAHIYLKPHGLLLLEIGHEQKDDILRIAAACDVYEDFNHAKDYSGYDRVVWMRKRG